MNRDDWIALAASAFSEGQHGRFDESLKRYQQAEEYILPEMRFSSLLNILRHRAGEAGDDPGGITNIEPTEDGVFGVISDTVIPESDSARGMKKTRIGDLQTSIGKYRMNGRHHLQNIEHFEPHLLVMSTGRCGTMSLYRLLQQTQYIPHHQFYYNVSPSDRLEQMCRHIEGNYDNDYVSDFWARTRAAEWLAAIHEGRPMATLNHHDTIFAPTFAMLHPQGKIIYLRRNPRDVFKSMYSKGQWGDRQLHPIFYNFNPEWEWKDQNLDIIEQIVWYLRFTETFSRALGSIMTDRWIEISADKLFARDRTEIKSLKDFLSLDISEDEIADHFSTVYNRKAHKIVANTAHLHKGGNMNVEAGMKIFEEMWCG